MDGLKQGEFEVYEKDGNLSGKGLYVENYIEGIWEYYNPDGSINRKELFENGRFIKEL